MASTNNIAIAIGEESVAGTVVARTHLLAIRGVPDLDVEASKERDPAISGRNMAAGFYLMSKDAKGNLPVSARPEGAYAMLWRSLMGGSWSAVQVGACIRLKYAGSEASCKIVASGSLDTLNSSVGTKGSESADSNFGTAGSIDLTGLGFDTIDELVAAVNGYADYSCEKIFEETGGATSADIIDITAAQGKDKWVYVWFSSTTSGVYKYSLPVQLGSTERPTLSVQYDGRQENDLYNGVVVDTISLSAALQGMAESEVGTLAFKEFTKVVRSGDLTSAAATVTLEDTSDLVAGMAIAGTGVPADTTILSVDSATQITMSANASASGSNSLTFTIVGNALNLDDVDPMIFAKGSTTFGGREYTYVSNISIEAMNNHRTDGFGQGDFHRLYHQKGEFAANGTLTLRLDANTWAEREKVFNNALAALDAYFYGNQIGSSGIKEMMLLEAPYCQLQTFSRPDNSGVFDAEIGFEAVYPKGTVYDDPFTVTFIIGEDLTA